MHAEETYWIINFCLKYFVWFPFWIFICRAERPRLSLLYHNVKQTGKRTSFQTKPFSDPTKHDDHNLLVHIWDIAGRNVILNRRNVDKPCNTTPERGKYNSVRRDRRSCGNDPTPSCAFWLSLSPPHTYLLLLGEICWNRARSRAQHHVLGLLFGTINQFSSTLQRRGKPATFRQQERLGAANTSLQKHRVWLRAASGVQRKDGEKEKKGADKYVPYQNFCLYPRPAVLGPSKPVKVLGEGRNRTERESWCGWGPRWVQSTFLYVLPPILSPAANFLNEP